MSNNTIKIEDNYNYLKDKNLLSKEDLKDNNNLPYRIGRKEKFNDNFFTNKHPKLNYISIDQNSDKSRIDEEIVFELRNEKENGENKYFLRSGNYIGLIVNSDYNVEIESRFGEPFLKHILNYISNIYVNKEYNNADKTDNKNQFQFILAYLFVNKLEKASISGLPKAYKTKKYHDLKFNGNIDVNNYIKKDIPFKGKISTQKRELVESEDIVNVLACTLDKINKDYGDSLISKRLNNIRSELLTKRTKTNVSKLYIKKAKKNKILSNPMFSIYKEILSYAESILLYYNYLPSSADSTMKTTGFLINVAELFEIYVRKLLSLNFRDWQVHSPKLQYYKELDHNIIPDIVMEKDGKILVFDTKYKRIDPENLKSNPSFRNDFFQIHAYMYNYKDKLQHGGLIYPGDRDNFEIKSADNKFHIFELGANVLKIKDKETVENKEQEKKDPIKESIDNYKDNENNFIYKIKELIETNN